MLTFYIITALIALVATALIVRPLFSGRSAAGERSMSDVEVFRDQLAEIDRDLAKGTIGEAEAEGARVEISRSLIAATHRAERSGELVPAPRGVTGMIAGLLLLGIPVLTALLYISVGAPGSKDHPFAQRTPEAETRLARNERPSQAEAEAQITPDMRPEVEQDPEYSALVEQLKVRLANRPEDAEGHRLLATGLMRLGQWVEARKAWEHVIEITPDPVPAEHYATLAEAMVLATGSYVSPEAEQALARALETDPTLPIARYYAGLALRQAGRLDQAISVWQNLRQSSPADAPFIEWIDRMLSETIAMRDGRGPSEADIAAAEEMSDEDRAVMIQGMVDRLSARLTEQGGTAPEWAQLIASHAALGQTAEAEQALIGALQAYPEGPDHDRLIAHAARLGIGDAPAASAPGPTAEDVAAAQQMSAEDRAAMIEGMVQRLEDRLAAEGGEVEEWLRLINAYMQLDRQEDAARVYALAQTDLEGQDAAGFLRERALVMGVISE